MGKSIRPYRRAKFLNKHYWLAHKAFRVFDKDLKAFAFTYRYTFRAEINEALTELVTLARYELGYSKNYGHCDLATSLKDVWVDMHNKKKE